MIHECCPPSGKAPVYSYRVELTFPVAAAGELFQAHITTKVSLANLVYYVFPYCKSRAALTPPHGSPIALNPIYPQAFNNPDLGYCLALT